MTTDEKNILQSAAEKFDQRLDPNDPFELGQLLEWLNTPERMDAYKQVADTRSSLNTIENQVPNIEPSCDEYKSTQEGEPPLIVTIRL